MNIFFFEFWHLRPKKTSRAFVLGQKFIRYLLYISYPSEIVDVSELDVGDVPVPEIVDDLGEVDGLGEGPGDVLSHAGRRLEPLRDAVDAPLVEQLGVHVAVVEVDHARALVRPHLRHVRQGLVPPGEEGKRVNS